MHIHLNSYKLIITISFSIALLSIYLSNSLWAQTREVVVVYFEPDIEGIGPGNKQKVKEGVKNLGNVDEYTVTLEGYSDITGRADYNLKLSRERAQLVKDYLLELGLDSNKIEVIGKGRTDKYAQGETDEALARNRRVNLIIEIPAQPEIQEVPPVIQDTSQEEVQTPEEEAPQVPTISLSDISGKIDKAIRKSASSGIVFSTPQNMKMGESYLVEAEVSYSFIETLSKHLEGFKLGNQLGLALSGNGLDILNEGMEIKTIENDSPSNWQWQVTPQTQGVSSLVLSVAIASESAILDDAYPTFHRVIDVKPNIINSITSSYWIMGISIVLIILIVAWILIRRIKINS